METREKFEISHGELSMAFRKAGATALNKVAAKARTEAVRAIREKYNIKYGAALDRIRVEKATPRRLEAWIIISDTAKNAKIPLGKFSARQNSQGVTVTLSSDWRINIRHAFIPKLQSKHRGVFMRKGPKREMKKGRYAMGASNGSQNMGGGDALTLYMRQPIIEMAGPTLNKLYLKSGAPDAVKAAARKLYGFLSHELKFRLNELKGKR